jgi:hypothetical protein
MEDKNVLIVETTKLLLNIFTQRFVLLPNEALLKELNAGIIFPDTPILLFGFPKSAVNVFVTVD